MIWPVALWLATVMGVVTADRAKNPAGSPGEHIVVECGRPAAIVVVPDEPTSGEARAACEIKFYVRNMSGAELPVARQSALAKGFRIVLGRACAALRDETTVEDGFTIRTTSDALQIKGANDRGTLYGAYAFLEALGVRWYAPDELGEVVPRNETITLPSFALEEAPSFAIRFIGKRGDWPARARSNVRLEGIDSLDYKSAHTFHLYVPADKYFDKHPDWFALVNGTRKRSSSKPGAGNQLCTSNPEVIQQVVRAMRQQLDANPGTRLITLFPNDGCGFCECDRCKSLDEPGWPSVEDVNRRFAAIRHQAHGSLSRRFMVFNRQVAEALAQSHPQVKVMVAAYNSYLAPPNDQSLMYPNNVVVEMCHGWCHNHRLEDDSCEINRAFRSYVEEWRRRAPGGLMIYEYYNKQAAVELPFPIIHTLRHDIPYYRRMGVVGLYTQYGDNAWTLPMRYYLPSRLLWDVNADVDTILEEYYEKCYGKAAAAMRQYEERLERAAIEYGGHLSMPTFDLPLLYTAQVIAECDRFLTQAEEAVDADLARARIAKVRTSYDYLKMAMNYVNEIRRVAQDAGKTKLSKKELAQRLAGAREKSAAIETFIKSKDARGVISSSNPYVTRFLNPEHVYADRLAGQDD